MAKINICDVQCVQDVGTLSDPFSFKITFECFDALEEDIEWKLIYVSSAYKEDLDQTLDSILVGPIPVGKHQFVLETGPPDFKKIPKEDIVGVTVVLIQAFYKNKEFIRVGYYVNNEYTDENLKTEPPSEPIIEKLERQIISSNPRVTRFPIDWGDGLLDGCPEPDQTENNEDPFPKAKKAKVSDETESHNKEAHEYDEEDDEIDEEEEDEEESDENAEHDVECSEDDEEDDVEESEEEDDDEDEDGDGDEEVDVEEKNENSNPTVEETSSKSIKENQNIDNSDLKEPFQEVSKN